MTQKPKPLPIRTWTPQRGPQFLSNAAWAAMLSASRSRAGMQNDDVAADICRRDLDDQVALRLLTRAAVDPGSSGTAGWASELTQTATADFFGALPQSAASWLIANGLSLDLGGRHVTVPHRLNAPAAGAPVQQGAPFPVRVTNVSALDLIPRALGCIVTLSREVVKGSAGRAVFESLLREDAALSLDAAYFSALAGSDTVHRGLLYGLDPIYGEEHAPTDLANLASAVSTGGSGVVAFITGPGRAAAVAVNKNIDAIVLPSLAVGESRLIAVDVLSLAHGFDVFPDIDVSTEALVHMSDEPLEIVGADGPTTADPVRSTWQTDGLAMRMQVDVAFGKRRTGAVAFIDNLPQVQFWV